VESEELRDFGRIPPLAASGGTGLSAQIFFAAKPQKSISAYIQDAGAGRNPMGCGQPLRAAHAFKFRIINEILNRL
jgi:hypothetical protein